MAKVISLLTYWFKEPEVYAETLVRETTFSSVFTTITQQESIMALREYGRWCHEIKWIEDHKDEDCTALINMHLQSRLKAFIYLKNLCDKYHFKWDLFIDIIDEEYMIIFDKLY